MLVAQKLGRLGRDLAGEGEGYQFALLVAASAVYVVAAWWITAVSLTIDAHASLLNVSVDVLGKYSRLILLQHHPLSRRPCWAPL